MTSSSDIAPWQQDDILAHLAHDAPCGLLATDPGGRLLYVNNMLADWLGIDVDDALANMRIGDVLSRESHLYFETQVAPMLHLQGFAREISCKLRPGADGHKRPVLMNATLREASGRIPARIDFAFFDATERLRYERLLRDTRTEAEELAVIVRNARVGIVRCDADGMVKRLNRSMAAILNVDPDTLPQDPIDCALRFDTAPDRWFADAVAQIHATGADHLFEAMCGDAHFNVSVARIPHPEEPLSPTHYSVIVRDITRRVRTEQRLKLVAEELNHRIKNVFTIVTGLVRQTLRGSKDERDTLLARLGSIAASHDILTRNHWQNADIRALLEPIRAQASDSQRIVLDGPEVRLNPSQFKALSMALHELSTNARKYGALSVEGGRIAIRWTLDQGDADQLTLSWRESGGPPVTPPDHIGFGTQMIERTLAAEFNGTAEIEWRTEGLHFVCSGRIEPS